jgi:glucose-1-phosphate thymidylyltransferase
MIQAGVQHIYLIISDGKWDILKYYGDGQRLGAYFSYLMVEKMHGMPYTINMAYPWIQGATVVFGMPDTIFSPGDAYQQLLAKHKKSNADLTLGLFETSQPWRFGMVDFDRDGKVLACIDKPVQTNLCYLWGNACWGPRFSEFLNEKLNLLLSGPSPRVELVLGDFFQMAVTEGMNVQSIPFTDGSYIDIGSPEELEKTIRQYIGS